MITNKYKRIDNRLNVYILGRQSGRRFTFWVSLEDEELVREHTWNVTSAKYICCTCHEYLLHRLITNAPGGKEVDHINRHPEDNLRTNLRIVSHAENMRNRQANKDNPLPVKGICWRGASWECEIRKNGHIFRKAGFDTLYEAVCWKIRREYELYGDKSPNYRPVLKTMPRHLLKIYFPEIYGEHNYKFMDSPIFNAHFKNSHHKKWSAHLQGVKKAGAPM